jgi:hypothetical protein
VTGTFSEVGDKLIMSFFVNFGKYNLIKSWTGVYVSTFDEKRGVNREYIHTQYY